MQTKWNFAALKQEFDALKRTKVLEDNQEKWFCTASLSPVATLELFPYLPGYKKFDYNALLKLFERDASKVLGCSVYVTGVNGWNRLMFISRDLELIACTKTKEEQERRTVSLTEFSAEGEAPYIDLRPRPHWLWKLRLWFWWKQLADRYLTFSEYVERLTEQHKLYL